MLWIVLGEVLVLLQYVLWGMIFSPWAKSWKGNPPTPCLFCWLAFTKLRFELDKLADFNLLTDLYHSRDQVCDVKKFVLSLFIRQKYTTLTWVSAKVMYPKYSKYWPYTVAHTIACVCSKMLNHGWNHGLFLSLFKLIPCPIHWIAYVIMYWPIFKFDTWILKQF